MLALDGNTFENPKGGYSMSKLDFLDEMKLAVEPIESYFRLLEQRSAEDVETASIGLILVDYARARLKAGGNTDH
jgi:hypothetical protein